MKTILSLFPILNTINFRKKPALEIEAYSYLRPIVIGVTGHRDLVKDDIPELESSVRKIFQELRDNYPNTPLHLLSPLAEGADRLVARIGLEFKVKLIVPLPMPRAEYETDFKTPESKTKFAELINSAERCFELPFIEGNTLHRIQNDPDTRNQQYAQVGTYIAGHSQILIALWDGVFKNVVGSTSNIIRFKEGDPGLQNPSDRILDPIDSGPVFHIVTRRQSNLEPHCGEVFSLHKRFPGRPVDDKKADRAYRQILKRMDDFNKDAVRLRTKKPDAVIKSKQCLINLNSVPKLSSSCRTILECYAISDALAIRFQKKRRRTMIGLFMLAGLAVISMTNYDSWISEKGISFFNYLLPAYLGFLGIAFLWHFCARTSGYQNKHLEYRALAEGLRVQFFWELAGINENVSLQYLRKQRTELEWIRNTIRTNNIPSEPDPASVVTNPKCNYCLVLRYWVISQRQYYQKVMNRDKLKVRWLELWMWLLIFLGIGVAGLLVIIDFSSLSQLQTSEFKHKILRIIMQIAPAIGAAFGGYIMKMALKEQAKRYQWMEFIYSRAEQCLARQIDEDDMEGAKGIIMDLGKEALIENGDWLLLHRERPMEVPVGG